MRKRKPPKQAVRGRDVAVGLPKIFGYPDALAVDLVTGRPISFTGFFESVPLTTRQFEWPICDVCSRRVNAAGSSYCPSTGVNTIVVACHGEVETIELKLKDLRELDSLEVGRAFVRRRLK